MKLHLYYVYILTTRNNTVLYMGVTNDLKRRVFEHKSELYEGFTKKYHVHKLIYYELFDFIDGKFSLDEAVNMIKQDTRRYAKRQVTWCKKYL